MSTKVCINCKVYQLKLAFIGKGTGLTEVGFVFCKEHLHSWTINLHLFLDNQQIVVNPNLHVCIQ